MKADKIFLYTPSDKLLPTRGSRSSACYDLSANIESAITIGSNEIKLIPTGIFLQLPENFEALIRPRSGLAVKYGITVLNTPGTIDADYRGEIKIILINHSKNEFTIEPLMRIAQIAFRKFSEVELIKLETKEELEKSERGEEGFGSTGFSK